jgi:hypothetical protein
LHKIERGGPHITLLVVPDIFNYDGSRGNNSTHGEYSGIRTHYISWNSSLVPWKNAFSGFDVKKCIFTILDVEFEGKRF